MLIEHHHHFINFSSLSQATYVIAGDVSAAAKIRTRSQLNLCDISILVSVFPDVTLKHWCENRLKEKLDKSGVDYRCASNRTRNEEREQNSLGRTWRGGGEKIREWRCGCRRLFSKYWPYEKRINSWLTVMWIWPIVNKCYNAVSKDITRRYHFPYHHHPRHHLLYEHRSTVRGISDCTEQTMENALTFNVTGRDVSCFVGYYWKKTNMHSGETQVKKHSICPGNNWQ